MQSTSSEARTSFHTIIIGTGFAGIGMAIALKKAGLGNFLILEKQNDVGGVWRDNTYPGAACDVPSHLYSFSFEPNPNWSRVFAPQAEIHQYLKHCARKYGLLPSIRFGCEVAQADYHESLALWTVTLSNGQVLQARFVVTATGQLSRPVYPKLEGMDSFKGHVCHSAHWDHSYDMNGKRVAVIGTGASAIQFVPAIAGQVSKLTVFQRSAAYILPRPDGPYAGWRKAMFRMAPWTMTLHRARIYSQYESRAVGFTRIKAMMDLAVGLPFKALLRRQVQDPTLRAQLTPDYPIGCKRILLSNEYLATMAKSNVNLVTQGIRRITADGIETMDRQHHPVDAIVYGTGFAATEFLAPMTITGRDGLELNEAWRKGAQAYLGITVPGFPNFFMLYGPNTNLGHSSIIYMLESQIAHVLRCMQAAHQAGANAIEVDAQRYASFNGTVQARLRATVWQGCKSWYVDANGHNSTNWPGFTFGYRWLTRYSSLNAYNFTKPDHRCGQVVHHAEPVGAVESFSASLLRSFLRVTFKAFIRPPVGVGTQRLIVSALARLMPGDGRARIERHEMDGMTTEVVSPKQAENQGATVLYLHGGGFCLGSAQTHRSVTTRLAAVGMTVWVPQYRLAPEHLQPAALEDALACYRHMLQSGVASHQIVLCGDSAGGGLALSLALTLRDAGEPLPAGLMLLSPFLDTTLSGDTVRTAAARDPMLNVAWLQQAVRWYAPEKDHHLLEADLQGLPPMLIQVGDQEVLQSDSARLSALAARCGVPCHLEVYAGRWHVFQLQAAFLASAANAVSRLATFAAQRTQGQASRHAWHEVDGDPVARAMAL
ncbi:MAG TPA: alpha/beta hydrolase fold domain-containing protein [Aquabacterium sp.]|uniref:flavin-containing monooxygenase n=1 Tax=Aquabacterium sp. TaxID=1872578 RepID=UPI002E32134E|nr:alpha/beta hydrolase fold domain-containing protein [Aquabacterium sp.]HEX5371906.1 alpha/beta hydrolase fold domain-containing protein [Aquabacterium sp.]